MGKSVYRRDLCSSCQAPTLVRDFLCPNYTAMSNNWAGFFGNKKGTKFKAKPVERHGIKFASTGEADRYDKLKLAEEHGLISDLKLQVSFKLEVNGILIAKYRADFTYFENGQPVVEDLKGYVTPEFRIKFSLMQACHGITIKLTSASGKVRDPMARPKAKKKKKPDEPAPALRMSPKTKQTVLKFGK